jgi:hypothetical protein
MLKSKICLRNVSTFQNYILNYTLIPYINDTFFLLSHPKACYSSLRLRGFSSGLRNLSFGHKLVLNKNHKGLKLLSCSLPTNKTESGMFLDEGRKK